MCIQHNIDNNDKHSGNSHNDADVKGKKHEIDINDHVTFGEHGNKVV